MKLILLTIAFLMTISCNGKSSNDTDLEDSTKSESRNFTTDVPIINFEGFKEIIESNKDKFLVINFWATWCKPCIEELPAFMEVNDKYKDDPDYKMILINLDQVKNMEGVKKFLKERIIDTEVYLLNDIKRMNIWIPEVEPSWSGAIPATIFYNRGEKILFQGGVIEKEKLDSIISSNYKQ